MAGDSGVKLKYGPTVVRASSRGQYTCKQELPFYGGFYLFIFCLTEVPLPSYINFVAFSTI